MVFVLGSAQTAALTDVRGRAPRIGGAPHLPYRKRSLYVTNGGVKGCVRNGLGATAPPAPCGVEAWRRRIVKLNLSHQQSGCRGLTPV
jgi:hypothetical protein